MECARPDSPGVYARVTRILDWAAHIMYGSRSGMNFRYFYLCSFTCILPGAKPCKKLIFQELELLSFWAQKSKLGCFSGGTGDLSGEHLTAVSHENRA